MTPAKRDWRESLRKMQMPLEIFFGFAPVPLLMGAIITPDAWAMPLITPAVYVLWAWLLIFVPGKLRVPLGVLGCLAVIAVAVLTMPVFTSAAAVLLPILFAAMLFYSWRIGSFGPDDELSLAIPAVSVVAHVVTQFLILADTRLGEDALYAMIRTPLILSFLFFMLFAILSMNRDSMQRAVNGGSRAPKKLRRRNILLSLIAMAIAVGVAAIPAIIEAATKLWDFIWKTIGDAVMWLLNAMGNRETASSRGEGSREPGGLPISMETSPLAEFLDKLAVILAAIALLIFLVWALRVLYRHLKKLFRFIADRMKQYAQSTSEDYVDEITDLRDESGARDSVLDSLRKRFTQPRVDEKSLPPRERIRFLYKKLNRKHAEWHVSATARENIPGSAAALYERARYSAHPVTEEDADRFRANTKGV